MTVFRAAEDYKSFLTANVLGGCNVTDEGVLDISHDAGIIFDVSNDINVNIVASAADFTLTDDDTNYLYWTAGENLAVKLTVPTGNEVLVATIVTAAGDISSITPAGFDAANLTSLSTRPVVILDDDNDPSFYAEALLTIGQENLLPLENSFAVRKETYRIIIDITVNASAAVAIKDLLAEIDSKHRTNNDLLTREYFYNMSFQWNASYINGLVRLVVEAKRRQAL